MLLHIVALEHQERANPKVQTLFKPLLKPNLFAKVGHMVKPTLNVGGAREFTFIIHHN